MKKVFLEISQNSLLIKITLLINFIKKETRSQVFSCEFCEIFQKNFFDGTPLRARVRAFKDHLSCNTSSSNL